VAGGCAWARDLVLALAKGLMTSSRIISMEKLRQNLWDVLDRVSSRYNMKLGLVITGLTNLKMDSNQQRF